MQDKLKLELGDILKPIEPHLRQVDSEIRNLLTTGIPLLDKSAYHLFETGGKKIRASLIILSSGFKNPPPENIIRLAAAAEVVHCASLIHDDIIDQSLLRRGVPTVSRVWGHKVAVLVGDYMYTRALAVAVSEEKKAIFPVLVGATSDMVKGELYQIQYADVDSINRDHYFKIIELKTARFMAACMNLGGVQGRMSEDECELMRATGLNLGFAFQVVDDTLDVVDNREKTGKTGGNDFLEGKITLPFLYLMENAKDGEKKRLMDLARNPGPEAWETVKGMMREAGSVEYCLGIANEFNEKAMESLRRLPRSQFRDIVEDLSKFLIERNH